MIPAPGRIIITDTATQSRRHVEWGLEGPLTYNSATSLLIDSDDMVTSGFSGVQAVTTGAYDPNASGNNSITLTPIAGATTAMCGTGNLSHVGVFRVKARVQSGSLLNLFRLSWKAGDGPVSHNTWATPISTAGWIELDLGTITIPATVLGTQRWTGQVEVQGAASSPGTVALDYLPLIPQADGYGKARAAYSPGTGALAAQDQFTGTTAGGALNTRTAPLGGAWATSGDATDFAFADDLGDEQIKRSATGFTTGRFGVLGSTSYTDTQVSASVAIASLGGTVGAALSAGVVARFTDSSNYIRAQVAFFSGTTTASVSMNQFVAGTPTGSSSATFAFAGSTYVVLQLLVFASGRAIAQVFTTAGVQLAYIEMSTSALATGGALASGKPGIWDSGGTGGATGTRYYDNFAASVPPAEPIAIYSGKSMQVRYDDTLRQDSTGTYYGRPPSYRGSRFLVPVGTSRVLVKARRNDIETGLDDNVTDALQIQIAITPRGLAVPR